MGNWPGYSAWTPIKAYPPPPLLSFHSPTASICPPHSPPSFQTQSVACWNAIVDSVLPPSEMFFSFMHMNQNTAQRPHIHALSLLLNAYTIHEMIVTAPIGEIVTSGKSCGVPKCTLALTTWEVYSSARIMILCMFYCYCKDFIAAFLRKTVSE